MNDHFLAGALLALTIFAGHLVPVGAQGEAAKEKKPVAAPVKAEAAPEGPRVVAVLVDAESKAQKRSAVVQAKANGITIVDPAAAKERAVPGQGHFHYRVDDGPIVATTSTKLSFHDLKPGRHTITVELAGNDHEPLAKAAELAVSVP